MVLCYKNIHLREETDDDAAVVRGYGAVYAGCLGIRNLQPGTERTDGPHLDQKTHICDAGCGLGYLSLALSPYAGHITAVDRNPDAVTVLADNCRRLGIGNITPRCGDIADVVPEVPYDAMVFCFFGGIQEILSTAKRQCDGQIFIITRNYTTHRFSVGSHKTGSYGYATTKELLEQLAIPFEEQTMELEFGQPFRSLEDARRFFETYSKDADKNAITDEFLRKS